MKLKVLLASLTLLSLAFGAKYAIVIQGDRGYGNYSDSSNSCRAYDDVLASGIPPENIIYMANEETLIHEKNPWPNQLFTLPAEGPGIDHAEVCAKHFDYFGKDIEPEVVLALLRQDKEEVKKLTGYEDPKVFDTTKEDTIFIYYTDHGYEGGVACGSSVIKRDQLLDVLYGLHEKEKYSKLVFYLEACESGSMFEGLDPKYNIYAMTSADSKTPAWCDYCPPDDVVNGKHIGTCMSMYYDNSYQAFWESSSTKVNLGEIFDHVYEEVKAGMPSQTPCEFGNLDMREDPITDYIGDLPIQRNRLRSRPVPSGTSIPKGEVERHLAKWRAIRSGDAASLEELRRVVVAEAKREVESLRLGVMYLGEMEAHRAFGDDSRVVSSSECSRDLSTQLIVQCGMSVPLPRGTKNVIHAICSRGVDVGSVNWSAVCI